MQWKMSGASVGCSKPRASSGTKTLRRCRIRGETDNIVFIDVDSDSFDNVIIIDVPESLPKKCRGSKVIRKDREYPWETVICLDDDENANNSNAHSYFTSKKKNSNAHSGVKIDENLNNGASSSKRHCPVSGKVGSSSNAVADDCELIQENISPVKLSTGKRTYSGKGSSRNQHGLSADTESGSSDSDYLDCEMEDRFGRLWEQWEKASLRKKCDTRNGLSGAGDPEIVFDERKETPFVDKEREEEEAPTHSNQRGHGNIGGSSFNSKKGVSDKDYLPQSMFETQFPCGEADHRRDPLTEEPPYENAEDHRGQHFERSGQQEDERDDRVLVLGHDLLLNSESCIINGREKLKETDEYKKALEEEWASRQLALQMQAEEAQQLRRLRKRMKAESMRLLDMERRQKQRVEEIRDHQKKDEENMNLKEVIRTAVRKELNQLEQTCHDMASLLQGLGVLVCVGLNPSSNEVRAAYKKALLTFHPDRASRSDMRLQVEAEEKFKLISRMKEKFLPACSL